MPSVLQALSQKAATLPTSAGVYLFKDSAGVVIYVGKAASLRVRVRQYLTFQDERAMVPFLVSDAADLDVVVTGTEKEAILLENTLIKKHRPRYNVKLVDDKNFLHLRIDNRRPWPRYHLVRRIKNDRAQYFGPYASASKARDTLAFLQRVFPLRTCSDHVLRSRKRPCLLYQMGRCVAPCVGLVDEAAYAQLVEESTWLLQGKHDAVLQRLRERMQAAAELEAFERAARLRDLIESVEHTLERQQMVDASLMDRDVWGLWREGHRGVVTILPVRDGVLGEPRSLPLQGEVGEDEDVLSSLLNTIYGTESDIPAEVLLPTLPRDSSVLEEVLTERRKRRVHLVVPQRGDKTRLVALASENARTRFQTGTNDVDRRQTALADLAEAIGLAEIPRRIECFDNSNIGGRNPVAAMSVFIDGKPDRAEYRRYKVKTVVGADDYATMREILSRRLRRGIAEQSLPDLLVVDGGKGQLGVAESVLDELDLSIPVVGISKPRTEHKKGDRQATDKIVLPDRDEPLRLPATHAGLRLLQHLRDEVHDHAVRYHRKVRNRTTLESVLEAVPGIGPSRRKALLKALGSADAVASADEATLAAIDGIGPALARTLVAAFSAGTSDESPLAD